MTDRRSSLRPTTLTHNKENLYKFPPIRYTASAAAAVQRKRRRKHKKSNSKVEQGAGGPHLHTTQKDAGRDEVPPPVRMIKLSLKKGSTDGMPPRPIKLFSSSSSSPPPSITADNPVLKLVLKKNPTGSLLGLDENRDKNTGELSGGLVEYRDNNVKTVRGKGKERTEDKQDDVFEEQVKHHHHKHKRLHHHHHHRVKSRNTGNIKAKKGKSERRKLSKSLVEDAKNDTKSDTKSIPSALQRLDERDAPLIHCHECGRARAPSALLLCAREGCTLAFHMDCLMPPPCSLPRRPWTCPCHVDAGEYHDDGDGDAVDVTLLPAQPVTLLRGMRGKAVEGDMIKGRVVVPEDVRILYREALPKWQLSLGTS